MAQSEATVTPPSPTPPTNMSAAGITGPNPPNYTKLSYAGMEVDPYPGTNPPAFPATQTAGIATTFAANTAAVAGGSAATAGGTEATYPGTGTTAPFLGAVPAGTSVPHEGGTTTVVKPPGNITHTYPLTPGPGTYTLDTTQVVSTLPAYTVNPNADHASAKAPSVLPTITNLNPNNIANGSGQQVTLVITGTGFRPDSVVNFAGIPQPTTYVSSTSLKVFNANKRASAGNTAVTVVTGGTATAPTNWAFT